MTRAILPFMLGVAVVAQDMQPFRSTAEAVRVDVSVQRGGRPIAGLAAGNFALFADGVPQEVVDLSYGRLPIDVTVALDVSASVSGQLLADLRKAVGDLKSRLRGEDRLKVIAFNMRVRRVMDFTGPGADTAAAFDRLAASGSTALFDTLAVTLTSAAPPDRRQLIIVFSDGADSSSISDSGVLLEVARRTTPAVAFVGPTRRAGPVLNMRPPGVSAQSGAGPSVGPSFGTSTTMAAPLLSGPWQFLGQIARETGGTVVPLPEVRGVALTNAFAAVLDDFRSSYVLHFTPRGVPGRGFHTLRVEVTGSGRVDVRARSGYSDR